MNTLEVEFNTLKKYTSHQEIEEQLQKIMAVFLNGYHLIVNNKIIEPIEVESYYYLKSVFEDEYMHKEDGLQDFHFGHPYFHKMNNVLKTGNYKGMDICLSNQKGMYFSLLIRSAIIDGNACYGPSNCLKEIFENDENYKHLYKSEQDKTILKNNKIIKSNMNLYYGTRYGLSENPNNFSEWKSFNEKKLRMVVGEINRLSSVKIKNKRKLLKFEPNN